MIEYEDYEEPVLAGEAAPTDDREMRKRLMEDVRSVFEAARSARATLDEKLPRLRGFARLLQKRKPPYEGAYAVTTPTIAARVDAIKSAVDQTFFKVHPFYSAVAGTGEAQAAVRTYEAMMDNILRLGRSLQEIKLGVNEAIEVFAGALKVEVLDEGPRPLPVARAVSLEDVYVYPTGSRVPGYISVFQRHRMPRGYLEKLADDGFFDPDAVKAVAGWIDGVDSSGQQAIGTTDTAWTSKYSQVVEVWEGWVRWEGFKLWRVYFHLGGEVVLRAEENPHPMLERPPYVFLTALPLLDSIYGMAVPQMLEAYQDIVDGIFNSALTEAEFLLAPARVVSDMTLYNEILDKGWAPGQTYLANRLPKEAIDYYGFSLPASFPQYLQLVQGMAEEAVPHIPTLPPGTRQTATAVQAWTSAGSARLSTLVGNLKDGLEDFAELFWELVRAYRVDEVTPVYDTIGRRPGELSLIGKQDLRLRLLDEEGTAQKGEVVMTQLMGMGLPVQVAMQVAAQIVQAFPNMVEVPVHGAYRDDIRWVVNGSDTIPEKLLRQQTSAQMLQTIPMIAMARNDRGIYNLLSRFYRDLGYLEEADTIGMQPDRNLSPEEMAQLMSMVAPLFRQLQGNQPPAQRRRGGEGETG